MRVRGSVTSGGRAKSVVAWAILFCAVAALVPVLAISDSEPPPPPAGGALVPAEYKMPDTEDIVGGYEAAQEEEIEREKELEQPAFVAEREASRHAYNDLSPAEAEHLLTTQFGEVLASLNDDPARFLSDATLRRSLGAGDAVVSSDGKTELMEGTLPVETKDDEGDLKKVDLTLEKTPEGYESENPLVDTMIGDSVEEGVEVGGEGLEIAQAGAEDSAARTLGDKNIFFGEVEEGSDTDLLVSPMSSGVELFDMLRSVESPETLRFHLELPEGASLHLEPGGGAEIRDSDNSSFATIPKPSAVDAQGTYVPVALEIEGDSVVLRVDHREQDLAYPILVDPEILYENGQLTWYYNQNLQRLASWGWSSNVNWIHHWEPEDVQWPGHRGLFIATPNGSLPGGGWGQYALAARNTATYISNAYIYPFFRANQSCPSPNPYPEPYDYDGMYDAVQGQWNGIHYNDANKYGLSNIGTWGHVFVIGMGTSSSLYIPCWRDLMVGGVDTWWGDWNAPNLTSVTGMPSGWIKKDNTSRTISVSAYDEGLGVQLIRLFGVGSKEWLWNQPSCAGTYGSECANSRSGSITFQANGIPYEGEQSVTVQAKDPVEHGYHSQSYTLKLDGAAPAITLSGQLATITEEEGSQPKPQNGGHDRLSLPIYNLNVKAQDGNQAEVRSGIQEIRLYLDGKLLESKSQSCPSGTCPSTLEWTYPLQLTGLTEGEHVLEVAALDQVGNEVKPQERKIEFEYIPATGMKEDYVLQHFALPDGHDYAEEPEYRGPELAVNVINGNLVYRERDFRIQAAQASLKLERFYNSQQPTERDGQWGHGWTLAQAPELKPQPAPQTATMMRTGAMTAPVELPATQAQQTFDPQLHATIDKTASGGYEVAYQTQSETSVFSAAGRIEETRLGDTSAVSSGETGPSEPNYTGAFGSSGVGDAQFDHPAGVAVDAGGNVWVVDRDNDRVERFDQAGAYQGSFGSSGSGDGEFEQPTDIAFDPEGNLWVVDTGNNRIEKFDAEGGYQAEFGSPGSGEGQFSSPESIAIDADGNVWVGDTYNARLQEFDEDGDFVKAVGSYGTGQGQIIEATGVAVDPEGNVWVADWGNNRISEFSEAGDFLRQVGGAGKGAAQFVHPDVIDVDARGHIWVGDEGNNRIQEFDNEGSFIAEFGSGGSGEGEFSFGWPMGVAADEAGHLWIADAGSNRMQEWAIPGFEMDPASRAPSIDYTYSGGSLTAMRLEESEPESNSTLSIGISGGLATSVDAETTGTATYGYESTRLMSVKDPEGETKYEYDSGNHLKKVELPNGTVATVAYDTMFRVTEVTVDPAGPEGWKTTHFWYGSEPRETKVWGKGKPEITYSIGELGSVLRWAYAEVPPTLEEPSGSLWGNRNSTQVIENKDHTLFVNASSQNEIASIQVLVNGTAVVAEETCEDNSKPPAHNCDHLKLEWITSASEHAAGRLNLEIVATDFLGRSVGEGFFVTVPQQPPPDPATPEKPDFAAIKLFREEYGLDREHPLSKPQMNQLILELLYEWEAQRPAATAAVNSWGVPMRAPELAEMEYRRTYTNQAAQVIPEWAEEHAPSSYGGFYVDDRAGGVIYVGFTENQTALVEELKQDSDLINPGQIREYPSPPTISVSSLESTAPSVTAALMSVPSIKQVTSSVHVSSEGNVIQVGVTDPGPVREFLKSHFGANAPIDVQEEQPAIDGASRYESKGPVVAGAALIGANAHSCTAGYGSRASAGQLRGKLQYRYFILTAGHCYSLGESVGREFQKFGKGAYIGYVSRSSYSGFVVTDGAGVWIDENLRSHSVLNGSPLDAEPIQGVQVTQVRKTVCWSGIYGGKNCGLVLRPSEVVISGHLKVVYLVKGLSIRGDSGGPVWDPITHKAVGLITGISDEESGKCWETSYESIVCSRMIFTPLLAGGGSSGIAPSLGVEMLKQG